MKKLKQCNELQTSLFQPFASSSQKETFKANKLIQQQNKQKRTRLITVKAISMTPYKIADNILCLEFSPEQKRTEIKSPHENSESLESKVPTEAAHKYLRSWFLHCNFSTWAACSQETAVICFTEQEDYTDLGGHVQLSSTYQTVRCKPPGEYGHCRTDSTRDEFYWRSRSCHSLQCNFSQYRTLRK